MLSAEIVNFSEFVSVPTFNSESRVERLKMGTSDYELIYVQLKL